MEMVCGESMIGVRVLVEDSACDNPVAVTTMVSLLPGFAAAAAVCARAGPGKVANAISGIARPEDSRADIRGEPVVFRYETIS